MEEYEIKAQFLFNFSKFIEWPPTAFDSPESPLIIGIVGLDPFGERIDAAILEKKVDGRDVVIARFATPKDLTPCHILFIAKSGQEDLQVIHTILKGRPTVTVSDLTGFVKSGGAIGFIRKNRRIRFEINAEELEKRGLKPSSKLLALASDVIKKGSKKNE